MGSCIYIFTNSYKPDLGGIQTVTSQVAETLRERGERVVVVTSVNRKALAPYSRICGVPVFRFHFDCNITFILLWILFFFSRPKAVYVHFPLNQSSFVLRLRKYFDFKLITCFHGHDVLRYNEGYSLDSLIYKNQVRLIEKSDGVTSCSEYLGQEVKRIFGCRKVSAVYNGVNLSRYGALTPQPFGIITPYLFAFGRLEKVKGYNLLIDAFAKIKCKKNIRLYIAGDGSLRMDLQKQITDLHLEKSIFLIGRKSPNEIVQLTQHAEAIVIPSLRESFGIVVLEAIASKRPVIATAAGGIPEIMDKRFGELVPTSVDGLVRGIEKALSRNDYQFDSVDDYLKGFTIDKMVDNYLNLIN